jgi:hypothetical protein
MKKGVFMLLLALLVCGASFAQTAPATSAVSGVLGLSAGRIVLKSGDTTYYTRGLGRFVGFIDGLREGAEVTIEGYVSPPLLEGANERLLVPVKLTIGDKTHEVGPGFAGARIRRPPTGPGWSGWGNRRGRGRRGRW